MIKRRVYLPVSVWRSLSRTVVSSSKAATATSSGPPISVPKRIKRKPTDLLKALATTVKDDPTGQPYMFVDDPLFTPVRPLEAQNFALSKELGRRTARYFAAQYPTLFMYDEDEPRLSAFRPTQKPRTENGDNEEALNDRIDRLWVRSAMTVYENAVTRNRPISTPTLLKLLELLAFYNHDDPVADLPEAPVEVWFRQHMNPPARGRWSDDGLAMKIYNSLPEPKDPRATAAIICGMLKYFAVQKGYELWQLSREIGGEEGKLKDARIYEALIKYGVERLKAVNSERWDLVLSIFKAMAEDGVKPTVEIFNAAFAVLTKASRWKRTEEAAKQLMQEMLQLGIQPSLATFYYVLRIHQKRPTLGSVMSSILAYLERNLTNRPFADEMDGKFFTDAMITACEQLHDKAMAFRVHRLLKSGDNYLYMTDGVDENRYYRALLTFLSITEDTKTFYERYYQRIVPRYYIPDARLVLAFLSNIEISNDYQYLSHACEEMIRYGLVFKRPVLWQFLTVALRTPTYQMTTDLVEKFIRMAKKVYDKIELQYEWAERQRKLDAKRGVATVTKEPVPTEGEDPEEAPEAGQTVTVNVGKSQESQGIRLEWTSDVLASLAVMAARGGAPRQAWTMFSRVVPLTEQELVAKRRKGETTTPVIGEVPEKLTLELLDCFVRQNWFDESYAALKVLARSKNMEAIKQSAEKIRKTIPMNAVQMARVEKYLNVWSDEKKEAKETAVEK